MRLVVAIEVDQQERDPRRIVEQHVGIVAVLAVGQVHAGPDVFEPADELERQAARHVQAADEHAVGIGEGIRPAFAHSGVVVKLIGLADRGQLRLQAVLQA